MVSITLSVSEEVRELMKRFPEVNWSGLIRNCIIEKAKNLEIKQELLKEFAKEKEFDDWAVGLVRAGRKSKK